eukprot:49833-Eustigmatos_ZCMA.PRE.1
MDGIARDGGSLHHVCCFEMRTPTPHPRQDTYTRAVINTFCCGGRICAGKAGKKDSKGAAKQDSSEGASRALAMKIMYVSLKTVWNELNHMAHVGPLFLRSWGVFLSVSA